MSYIEQLRTLTIQVTREDIASANGDNSPLILAMRRVLLEQIGKEAIWGDFTEEHSMFLLNLSELDTNGKNKTVRFAVPPKAADFYDRWKSGGARRTH